MRSVTETDRIYWTTDSADRAVSLQFVSDRGGLALFREETVGDVPSHGKAEIRTHFSWLHTATQTEHPFSAYRHSGDVGWTYLYCAGFGYRHWTDRSRSRPELPSHST